MADPHPGEEQEQDEDQLTSRPSVGIISLAQVRAQQDGESGRNRSPTPPRALFRSTTGKGVAFTDEDVNFLVRFMDYRKLALFVALCPRSDLLWQVTGQI
jgi:hypothetical protein